MRKILVTAITAFGLSFGAQAADLKVGFVNIQAVMQAAPQAEQATKTLEDEFAPQQREMIADSNELKSLQEKYQKDAAVMSDSERQSMERRIRDLQRDLQRRQQQLQEDVQIRRNEVLGNLQRAALEATEAYAKENGFDLILIDGVVYASDAVNVTSQVVERIRGGK